MGIAYLLERHSDPHLRSIFELDYPKTMSIQFAFFSAYSILRAVVKDREYHRLQDNHGGRPLTWPVVHSSSYLPQRLRTRFSDRPPCSRRGNYWSAGVGHRYVDLLGKPETASSRLDLTQAAIGTIAPKMGGC